jgi:hypothetical protein
MMKKWLLFPVIALLALVVVGSAVAAPLSRDRGAARTAAKALQNERTPLRGAPEIPLRPYTEYTYYTELAGILNDIAKRAPTRVQVIQQTNSANGNPLYLVVITKKMSSQQKLINSTYRDMLLSDPGFILSQNWLKDGSSIRPAVFINCSIHGGETTGMDAGLQLIRRLAFANDAETLSVLSNLIVVVNPTNNPDGRFTDSRPNGHGFDMNRDFIELSQAETQQTVKNIAEWVPLSFDDLHGYVNPILIEPTTFPHNPSLEYDLLVKNTLHQAELQVEMNAEETGYDSQIPYLWGTLADKFDNANEGWDDYGPYYTPQIAQYYGSMGQTVETPYKTNDGVAQHYWVAWASVANCLEHKWQLAKDQATMLMRGDQDIVSGRPWAGNMTDMVRSVDPATGDIVDVGWYLPNGSKNPAFPYSNLVGDITFPYAYVIPVDDSLQQNPTAVVKFVNQVQLYGAEVEKATAPFTCNNTLYPTGTYVVKTAQPLRPLVNNLLWDGEDVGAQYGVSSMYDIAVWSLPYMWRFDRATATTAFAASLTPVTSTQTITGTISGSGPIYAFAGDSNIAIKTVNQMLARGYAVGMVTTPLAAPNNDIALGDFVVDATERQVKAFLRKTAAPSNGVSFETVTGVALSDTSVINTGARRPSVRVNVDAQSLWALKAIMGFDNISSTATPGGNVFVNSSSSITAATVQTWLDGDSAPTTGQRRTYIGIAKGGTSQSALMPGVTQGFDPDPFRGDNGFCPVTFKAGDIDTAGYPSSGFVFTYPAAWFTVDAVVNPNADVEATYQASTGGIYQSGFWNDPNNTTAGIGKAAMVNYEPQGASAHGRVVFMGFHPLYRAQPEGSYLLVARQILLSAATPPEMPTR